MKSVIKRLTMILGGSLLFVSQANAALLTSNTIENGTLIDFEGFNRMVPQGPESVDIGMFVGEEILVSSATSQGFFLNISRQNVGSNGDWGNGKTFVGARSGTLQFEFTDGPVASVGAFMNYAPSFADLVFTALDQFGQVLETINVTQEADIITPGNSINMGEFRGIQRQQADIAVFQVSGENHLFDDFVFSRQTSTTRIPEPNILAFFVFGLSALWFIRRRSVNPK